MPSARNPVFVAAAPSTRARLLDAFAHQAAWWWCVLAARAAQPKLAFVGPLVYVAGHLFARPGQRRAVLALALCGGLTGSLGDALLVRMGYVSAPAPLRAGVALPFMAALWAIAAVSLTLSSASVARLTPGRAALVGAVIGPLAYAGGARLSVLMLSRSAPLAIALEWALSLPLLTSVARALERQPAKVRA